MRPASSSRTLAGRITGTDDPAMLARLLEQVERVGSCTRPVRVVGHVAEADLATGELRGVYATSGEPDGTLLIACGTRRASRCPACAAVYQRDAWHLIAAGLRGGKDVPASVAAHPLVFATFTAPSFGEVHHHRPGAGRLAPCAPRDPKRRCTHGRPVGCWVRHDEHDPRLGAPLCADCYATEAAVLWNALAPSLWRRTTIAVRRALARSAGLSERACRSLVRVRYVKVAEFQRRGTVHFHALIRLDGAPPADDPARLVAPPERFTSALLARAVAEAAGTAAVPVPVPEGHVGPVPVARWGEQVDVQEIALRGPAAARVGGRGRWRPAHAPAERPGTGEGLGDVGGDAGGDAGDAGQLVARAAGYLAKYAVKAAEGLGLPDRPLSAATVGALEALGVPAHVARLAEAAWRLGGLPHLAPLRLRRWAHMLGFGGHFATKSRRYSTTFTTLRRARAEHARRVRAGGRVPLDAWGRSEADGATVRVGWWKLAGFGYRIPAGAALARAAAARARDHRDI